MRSTQRVRILAVAGFTSWSNKTDSTATVMTLAISTVAST